MGEVCALLNAFLVSRVFVCVSGFDGGERAGCEMVHASSGRVYIRQVGRSGAYHHYRLCPAVSGYVFVNGKHSQTVL